MIGDRLRIMLATVVEQLDGASDHDDLSIRTGRVVEQVRALLAEAQPVNPPEPVGVGPSSDEIYKLALDGDFLVDVGDGFSCMVQDEVEFAYAVLARWGRPAPEPVSLDQRPWEREGWCDAEGMCWWFDPEPETAEGCAWTLEQWVWTLSRVTHTLPHWALPVPQTEAEQ
jgi:hypothetical protein